MPVPIAVIEDSASKGSIGWGEIVDGIKFYPCHRAQLDVLGSKVKYTAAFFGTGAGKTAMLPIWLYLQMYAFRKAGGTGLWRALVVSPDEKSFESSQLKQHLLSVFGGTIYEGDFNDQKKIYRGPGFEIVVRTADNDYRRISGGQYNAIAVDEAFQIKNPEVWDEVRRRSNILDAPVLVVTTPNADGWLFSGLMQPFLAGDPEFYVRQAHTRENPAKTPEQHKKFLDAERIKLGQAKFDRMYGGLFAQLTGLVYEAFSDEKSADYPVIPATLRLPSPAIRAFGSVDWGYYPDPFSAHMFVHCEDDRVYMVDEIYENKLQLDVIGRRLRDWMDKWSMKQDDRYGIKGGFFGHYFCDTSNPAARTLVQRFGVSITNNKVQSIDAGISIVDQLIRVGRLKVFDNCANFIREARSFTWDKNGKPVGNAGDHSLDDTRYGLASYFQGRPITLIPDEAKPQAPEEVAVRLGFAADAQQAVQLELAERQRKILEHQNKMMNWEPGD